MPDPSLQPAPLPRPRGERAVVHPLPFYGDDARLVESLREGHPAAVAHFYGLFVAQVQRLLFRILGPDSELEDTVHDTFVRALESIHTLRDPVALRSWVVGVAVFTARIRIQSRTRRRWLLLRPPEELPEPACSGPSLEVGEALRATYRVLQKMRPEERIAVVLRLVEGMTMPEAAAASGVSLSTFKRRLERGEKIFHELVATEPALRGWREEGSDGL
jgi:RNA polymerase sigma-70 factor (ECF subfamily)